MTSGNAPTSARGPEITPRLTRLRTALRKAAAAATLPALEHALDDLLLADLAPDGRAHFGAYVFENQAEFAVFADRQRQLYWTFDEIADGKTEQRRLLKHLRDTGDLPPLEPLPPTNKTLDELLTPNRFIKMPFGRSVRFGCYAVEEGSVDDFVRVHRELAVWNEDLVRRTLAAVRQGGRLFEWRTTVLGRDQTRENALHLDHSNGERFLSHPIFWDSRIVVQDARSAARVPPAVALLQQELYAALSLRNGVAMRIRHTLDDARYLDRAESGAESERGFRASRDASREATGTLGDRVLDLMDHLESQPLDRIDHGSSHALAALYHALFTMGLLSERELLLTVFAHESPSSSAAAVSALGMALADEIRLGRDPDLEPLNLLLFSPSFQLEANQAILRVFAAQARAGIEPDWTIMRKLLYRAQDETLFRATVADVCAVCMAWREGGRPLPASFTDYLVSHGDAAIETFGTELQGLASSSGAATVTERADPVTTIASPPALSERDWMPLRNRLSYGTASDRARSFATMARACTPRVLAGELDPTVWRAAVWRRRAAGLASGYGADYERWYHDTDEPLVFAANAWQVFTLKRDRDSGVTDACMRYLESEAGLNGSLCLAFRNVHAPPDVRGILALPEDVIDAALPNVLFLLGVEPNDPNTYAMMLYDLCSDADDMTAVLAVGQDGGEVRTLGDGRCILTARVGRVLRDGVRYEVLFDETNMPEFEVLAQLECSTSLGWRSPSAARDDLPLPELDELGIARPFAAEPTAQYIDRKHVALGLLRADGVAIPETMAFYGERETTDPPLLNGVQHLLETLPDVFSADEQTPGEIAERVRTFMREHGLDEVVVKPSDGECGRGVHMLQGSWESDVPERIAALVVQFRDAGSGAVIQRRIHPPLLTDADGKALDWNVRVWIAPDEDGTLRTWGCVARTGEPGKAVNLSIDAGPTTIDEVIEQLRVLYPELGPELDTLEERILSVSLEAARSMERAILADGSRSAGMHPFSDPLRFMGSDVMISREGNRLVPRVIEMNDVRSGGMGSLRDHLQKLGESHPLYAKYHGGYQPLETRLTGVRMLLRERAARRAYETPRGPAASPAPRGPSPTRDPRRGGPRRPRRRRP